MKRTIFCIVTMLLALEFGSAKPSTAQTPTPADLAAIAALNPAAEHTAYLKALSDAHADGFVTDYADLIPMPIPDNINAAQFYLKLADETAFPAGPDEYAATKILSEASPSEGEWANAQRFLTAHAELMALVHEAANRQQCVVDRKFNGDPAAILFTEYAAMRRAVRLLTLESLLIAHAGNPAEAVRNDALGFQIARQEGEANVLIGYLVQVAEDAIALRGMARIMNISGGDSKTAEAVVAALGDFREPSITSALRAEAAMSNSEMDHVRRSWPGKLGELTGDLDARNLLASLSQESWNALVDSNTSTILYYFRRIVAASEAPFWVASPKLAAIDAERDADKSPKTMFASIPLPVFTQSISKQAQIDAHAAVTRAGADVLVWRGQHGSFPASLDEAMATVPPDPFDGSPLRYKLEPGGFVVYSVGQTGKYDGMPGDNGATPKSEVAFRFAAPK